VPEVKQEITDTMSLFLKSEWTKIFIFKIKVKLTKCHRDTKIKEKQNNYFSIAQSIQLRYCKC